VRADDLLAAHQADPRTHELGGGVEDRHDPTAAEASHRTLLRVEIGLGRDDAVLEGELHADIDLLASVLARAFGIGCGSGDEAGHHEDDQKPETALRLATHMYAFPS